MKSSELHEKLAGPNSLSYLKEWLDSLKESENSNVHIKEFFAEPQNKTQLLKLLGQEKLDSISTGRIFTVINTLLSGISKNFENLEGEAIFIIQHIVRRHSGKLRQLINRGEIADKVIGLQFLTYSATIGSIAATDVLSNVQWKIIDFNKILNRKDKNLGGVPLVRKAVLELTQAYLSIEDTECLTQFLKLPNPLSCVVAGFSQDKAMDVVQLLTVLYRNVIRNESISKNLKRRVFKDAKAHHLLSLYTSPNKQWNGTEKRMVLSSVHQFMMALCTSSVYGIVGESNDDIFLMFRSELAVMHVPEGVDLVAAVISSCHDVRQSFMSLFKKKLNSSTNELEPVMTLLTEVFEKDSVWITEDLKYEATDIEKSLSYIPYSSVTRTLNDASTSSQLVGQKMLNAVYGKSWEALVKFQQLGKEEDTRSLKSILIKGLGKHQTHVNMVSRKWTSLCDPQNPSLAVDTRMEILLLSSKILKNYCLLHETRQAMELVDVFDKIHHILMIPDDCKTDGRFIQCLDNLLTVVEKSQEYIGFMLIRSLHLNMDLEETPLFKLLRLYQIIDRKGKGARNLRHRVLRIFSTSLGTNGIHLSASEAQPWLDKTSGENDTTYLKFLLTIVFETIKNIRCYKEKIHQLEIDSGMETDVGFDLARLDMEMAVEDSEDICVLHSNAPFSLLVLSAIDNLHQKEDESLNSYFSSVMSVYIYSLSMPEVLARFLLLDENLLSKSTVEVLQSFMGLNAKKSSSSENSILDKLRNSFRSEKCPHFSKFRSDMENILDNPDLLPLVRQLLLFIQREHHYNFKEKRPAHLKFFCKVLKEILKLLKLDPNSHHESGIVQFLLGVPLLQDNYNPFSDEKTPNPINQVVKALLHLAFVSPFHHAQMRPYFEKLLSHFLCIESFGELKVLRFFEAFIPSEIYTYKELQDMAFHSTKLCVDINTESASLLCLFIKSLKEGMSASQYPSYEVMKQLVDRRKDLSNSSLEGSDQASALIESLSVDVLSSSMEDKLKKDLCKRLLACDDLGTDIKSCLVNRKKSFCVGIVKQWHSADPKPTLELEAPILASLTEKIGDRKDVDDIVRFYKEDIVQWTCDHNSQNCENRKALLHYLMKIGEISNAEAASICSSWFEKITTEICPMPEHIISLCDLFQQTGSFQRVQLLMIFVHGVRKNYKKDTPEHAKFLSIAPQIISQMFTQEESAIDERFYAAKVFWPGFVKQVLRTSLTDSVNGSKFIDCLNSLCKRVFSNGSQSVIRPNHILEKLLSHSLYLPTLLQSDSSSEVLKESIINLQQTLVELDSSLCQKNHIPVLLGAYGATLSSCDQAIYKLLFTYEKFECRTTYPPVLWGSGAVSHFALEATVIDNVGAFRAPTPSQIFHIIDPSKVMDTAFNFNPDLDYEPTSCSHNSTIYDQRHLLLVFNHVCSVATVQMKKDLLFHNFVALALAALTSSVDRIWGVGVTILKKIHSLLLITPDNHGRSSSKEKGFQKHLLWIWLIEVTRNSLRGKRLPLPTITAHVLIRASDVIKNPSSPEFMAVLHQIFQHSSLRLGEVPGIHKLLFHVQNPPVPENVTFAMSWLKTGVKTPQDWLVCLRNSVPKYLVSILKSDISSLDVKNAVLESLNSMSQIEAGAKFFVEDCALSVILQKVAKRSILSNEAEEKTASFHSNITKLLLSLWKYSINHASNPVKVLLGKRPRKDGHQNPSKRLKTGDSTSIPVESDAAETTENNPLSSILGQFSTLVPVLKEIQGADQTILKMVEELQKNSEFGNSETICSKIQDLWANV